MPEAVAASAGEEPLLHVKLCLGIHFFPQGNELPMLVSAESANLIPASCPSVLKKLPTGEVIVDAHSVNGIPVEEAIAGIAEAVPLAMSQVCC